MANRTSIVPGRWHFETASLLLRAERPGRISQLVFAAFIETLMRLPIETDTESESRAHGPILVLARSHALTPYDASYLDLAICRALPLATRDQDLIKATHRCRVVLIGRDGRIRSSSQTYPPASSLDIWETIYLHPLHGEDAVMA